METDTSENRMMFFALYTTVGTIGIVANVLVLQTFWKERKKSLFHIQLALTNICSLAIIGFIGPASLRGRFFFGKRVCQYTGFHAFLFGFAEINFTCLVCWECLVAILKKSEYKDWMTSKVQTGLSAGAWAYSIVFSMAPLYEWGRYGYEPSSTSCGIDLNRSTTDGQAYLLTATVIFGVMIAASVVAMIVAFYKRNHNSCSYSFEPLVTDIELLKISTSLLVLLAVCSAPFGIRVVRFIQGASQPFQSFLGVEFSHLAMKLPCCLHPMVYFIFSEEFKRKAKYMVTGIDPEKKNR